MSNFDSTAESFDSYILPRGSGDLHIHIHWTNAGADVSSGSVNNSCSNCGVSKIKIGKGD